MYVHCGLQRISTVSNIPQFPKHVTDELYHHRIPMSILSLVAMAYPQIALNLERSQTLVCARHPHVHIVWEAPKQACHTKVHKLVSVIQQLG